MHCSTAIALGLSLRRLEGGYIASGPAAPAASRRVRLASGRPAPRTLRAARLVLRLLPTRRLHVHCAPPSLFPSTGDGPWPAGSTNLPKSSRRGSGSSRPPKTPLPCLQRRWRLTRDGNTGYTLQKESGVRFQHRRISYNFVLTMARQRGPGAPAHALHGPEICAVMHAVMP